MRMHARIALGVVGIGVQAFIYEGNVRVVGRGLLCSDIPISHLQEGVVGRRTVFCPGGRGRGRGGALRGEIVCVGVQSNNVAV